MPDTKKKNLERLQEEVFKGAGLEWKVSPKLGPDLPYVETEHDWYFNKRGTDVVYVQSKKLGNTRTKCYECRVRILEKPQQVTEWSDDLGPCTGGDVRTRYVKYCPKCEEEPRNCIVELS